MKELEMTTKIEKNPISLSWKDSQRFFAKIENRTMTHPHFAIGVKLDRDVATDAIHEILRGASGNDWNNIDSLKEHIADALLDWNESNIAPNGWGADDQGRYCFANWIGEFYLAIQGRCLPNRDAMLSDSELDDLQAVTDIE